jgi:hypothetical protein
MTKKNHYQYESKKSSGSILFHGLKLHHIVGTDRINDPILDEDRIPFDPVRLGDF